MEGLCLSHAECHIKGAYSLVYSTLFSVPARKILNFGQEPAVAASKSNSARELTGCVFPS